MITHPCLRAALLCSTLALAACVPPPVQTSREGGDGAGLLTRTICSPASCKPDLPPREPCTISGPCHPPPDDAAPPKPVRGPGLYRDQIGITEDGTPIYRWTIIEGPNPFRPGSALTDAAPT